MQSEMEGVCGGGVELLIVMAGPSLRRAALLLNNGWSLLHVHGLSHPFVLPL